MQDDGARAADLETAGDALDALLPGLGDAMIDLLDALNDRVDELGPARPDLLAELEEQLAPTWARTPPAERPLAVLDVLRDLMKARTGTRRPRRDRGPDTDRPDARSTGRERRYG